MFNIEITKRLLNKEMTNKYIFFKIQLDRDTHYKTFGRGKGVCVCVCVCGGGGGVVLGSFFAAPLQSILLSEPLPLYSLFYGQLWTPSLSLLGECNFREF